MNGSIPSCSVVIPTYNGESRVVRALSALNSQKTGGFEVVVVIDGSVDQTYETLKRLTGIRYQLVVINSRKNRGRARARNIGSFFAKGRTLVFLDDDLVPEPSWLLRHLNFHYKFNKSILVGSLDDTDDIEGHDFLEFKNWLHRRWTGPNSSVLSDNVSTPIKIRDPYITASNFSISRDDFRCLGRFNRLLNDLEDYELACRATKSGFPLYLDRIPTVFNVDRVNHTARSYLVRLRCYHKAREKLYTLGLVERPAPEKKNIIGIVKCFVYRLFCYKFWVVSIDKGYLTFLPQKVRYRLYDIILTSNSSVFPDLLVL